MNNKLIWDMGSLPKFMSWSSGLWYLIAFWRTTSWFLSASTNLACAPYVGLVYCAIPFWLSTTSRPLKGCHPTIFLSARTKIFIQPVSTCNRPVQYTTLLLYLLLVSLTSPISCWPSWILPSLIFPVYICASFPLPFTSPWRWMQHGNPQCWYPTTSLCGVTMRKTETWIFIVTKTSSLALTYTHEQVFLYPSTWLQ